MVIWVLLAIGLFFAWLFWHLLGQPRDELLRRRERYRQRSLHSAPEQPVDSKFVFDPPSRTDDNEQPGTQN